MSLPEKHRVREAVLEKLSEQLAHALHAAEGTRKDATHEEAKPENDKDTRALEQSYLARGQAMRAEEVLEQVQVLRYLQLPAFGESDVISAVSPLGKAVLGRGLGDEVQLRMRGSLREYVVSALA